MENVKFCKVAFYVPKTDLESVKKAVFDAGAGKQGRYDQACWQCLGEGQFRPLEGAEPAIGEVNKLTFVPEYKVELLCPVPLLNTVIAALKKAHPYEEPAYEVLRLEEF